jgi:hypothetical protein
MRYVRNWKEGKVVNEQDLAGHETDTDKHLAKKTCTCKVIAILDSDLDGDGRRARQSMLIIIMLTGQWFIG